MGLRGVLLRQKALGTCLDPLLGGAKRGAKGNSASLCGKNVEKREAQAKSVNADLCSRDFLSGPFSWLWKEKSYRLAT